MSKTEINLETGGTLAPIWFEKSVEYAFVIQAIHLDIFSLIFPLDGAIEGIGDTVFAKDSKYIIVEFKLTLGDLSAEYSKYAAKDGKTGRAAFVEVIKEIKKMAVDMKTNFYLGGHHFLVGGELENNINLGAGKNSKKLKLKIVNYFDAANALNKDRFKFLEMDDIKNAGIPKADFDEYISVLLSHKDGDDGGGGGGRSEALVVGLAGNDTAYTTLRKYELMLKAELSHTPPPPKSRGTLSRGR